MRIEVNGRPATAEALAHPALVNYGHFTAMRVRGGRVRGLDAHLRRLDAATRELFGTGLTPTASATSSVTPPATRTPPSG